MSMVPTWAWVAFHVVIFLILALDLGVLSRGAKIPTVSTSLKWTAFWIVLSLAFCGLIYRELGTTKSGEWLSAYVLEYALSVDNIFVFLVVFRFFSVPAQHQHKVLFWGIIGAFVLRAAMIFAGAAAIQRFAWIEAGFGIFLVYTAWKLAFGSESEVEPAKNPALKALRRVVPVSNSYDGGRFWTQENGARAATPLLAVLLVIETTDLLFALDSIPATLSVVKSGDAFIAYSANICAILGLRSLFFAVSGIMGLFHFLKYGLSLVLAFVGVKMLVKFAFHRDMPTFVSLGIIVAILAGSVLLSVLRPQNPTNVS